MKKTQKGFTLIELLVVIAIIGILSGIVLVSLSTARNKGNDAKVQGQLASIRSAGEVYYSTNNNYGAANAVCGSGSFFGDTASGLANLTAIGNYPSQTALACNTSGSAWAVSASLATPGTYWCSDSTGQSKKETAAVGAGTQCQ